MKTLLQYLFPVKTGEIVNGETVDSKSLYTTNKPLFVFSQLQDILQRPSHIFPPNWNAANSGEGFMALWNETHNEWKEREKE